MNRVRSLMNRLDMQSLYPRQDWAKGAFRLPLALWRLGLGPIFGRIILILTSTGRHSGQPRRTAVEYHIYQGRKYMVSAFGARSSWYANLLADPYVTIQSVDGTERMIARRVQAEHELLGVVETFMRRDPPITRWYFKSLDITPTPDEILANRERIHILRLDPTDEPTPPGLEVDLAWLWPLVFVWLLIFRPCRRRK